jgi:Flp pilus assembly protein TadD
MEVAILLALLALFFSVICFAETRTGVNSAACGSLTKTPGGYGPFDYSDPQIRAEKLYVVESYHFTPDVEQLRAGKSSTVAGDLDYTLRAFPNHHRALNSMARLGLAKGNMSGARYSVDCYFDRAIRWRPEDPVVRGIYANYLFKKGDTVGARQQYDEALRLGPNSPEISYNAGLFFVAQKDYDRARALAKVAYAGGYPLPGLKNKLQEAGEWTGL